MSFGPYWSDLVRSFIGTDQLAGAPEHGHVLALPGRPGGFPLEE